MQQLKFIWCIVLSFDLCQLNSIHFSHPKQCFNEIITASSIFNTMKCNVLLLSLNHFLDSLPINSFRNKLTKNVKNNSQNSVFHTECTLKMQSLILIIQSPRRRCALGCLFFPTISKNWGVKNVIIRRQKYSQRKRKKESTFSYFGHLLTKY